MDVVIFRFGSQIVKRCSSGVGAVPADVRDGLVRVLESIQPATDHTQARNFGILDRAFEEGLHADTDAHEGLAGLDVILDRVKEAGLRELAQAVAEVADTGKNQFLYNGG